MQPYHWPGRFTPRESQKETVRFLVKNPKAFCLDGLGTGKTMSATWAMDFMMQHGLVRRALIVAPLSICDWVWERELFQTLPHRHTVRLKGNRRDKQKKARDTRFQILVVNPESLNIIEEHLHQVDLVIVDEFTKFKNHRSKRWKALYRVTRNRRLWLMSGTPAPQGPLDAYGPIKLVRPKPPSFLMYRDATMMQVSQFTWVPKEGAENVVAEYMQPAIRHKAEDCYDMPRVSFIPYEVPLTAAQEQSIQDFQTRAASEIEGNQIPATTAAAVLSKCLQAMAGGVYYDGENGKNIQRLDATPYFEACESIVEQADSPVLVFVPFRSQAQATYDYLVQSGHRAGLITGDTHERDRGPLFDRVQANTIDALVAVAGTMSHGLTLTTARYILWASPPYSFEEYEQANGRVIRHGQKNPVIIYHLVQNQLARMLFNRLRTREKLQTTILNLLQNNA